MTRVQFVSFVLATGLLNAGCSPAGGQSAVSHTPSAQSCALSTLEVGPGSFAPYGLARAGPLWFSAFGRVDPGAPARLAAGGGRYDGWKVGSLTIDTSEESGWVYAGLGASTYSNVDVKLDIAGWWSCSKAQLPPARSGATACLPTGGEATMLQQLAKAGLSVDAASASVASAFFPLAASVCLMDVGTESFEAAFFEQRSLAAAVRVCASRSGSRYLYRVDGRTMDSAYRLYWSVAEDALLWTDSANLDNSLRRDLNGVPPPC